MTTITNVMTATIKMNKLFWLNHFSPNIFFFINRSIGERLLSTYLYSNERKVFKYGDFSGPYLDTFHALSGNLEY